MNDGESREPKDHEPPVARRSLFDRRIGRVFRRLPFFAQALARMPLRNRPALYFETIYNIGTGAFFSLFLLSGVVISTILFPNKDPAADRYLAILAAMWGGSSLFSPLVSYIGRWVPMQRVVGWPNLLVAALLATIAIRSSSPAWFTVTIGLAFMVRVFPRVGEMNMYRILYPPGRRGSAVGWVKAIAAISGLMTILLGFVWFGLQPELYWVLYSLVAAVLVVSTVAYLRIPVSRHNVLDEREVSPSGGPLRAFREGLWLFLTDRRFLLYQFGFAFAGTANHMVWVYVPVLLKGVEASDMMVRLVAAVMPAVLITASAPVWGRFLDRVNPMLGRATFNVLQGVAFALFAAGGVTGQLWVIILGATLHGISNGGSAVNWLTGSLYFARPDKVSLYNTVHVGLTGIRGLVAPLVGLVLYTAAPIPLFGFSIPVAGLGPHIFWIAAGMSLCGVGLMTYQGLTDPGPRETVGVAGPAATKTA